MGKRSTLDGAPRPQYKENGATTPLSRPTNERKFKGSSSHTRRTAQFCPESEGH